MDLRGVDGRALQAAPERVEANLRFPAPQQRVQLPCPSCKALLKPVEIWTKSGQNLALLKPGDTWTGALKQSMRKCCSA
eukprot:9499852-Pyramimonas_sp.AAC.1